MTPQEELDLAALMGDLEDESGPSPEERAASRLVICRQLCHVAVKAIRRLSPPDAHRLAFRSATGFVR
jgi:hypothetical protein